MKPRLFLLTVLVVFVATAIMPLLSMAQNKRVGTAAATQLLIPVGARGFAMGGSSVAVAHGVEAIHWNPAGLGRMDHSAEGLFSTMSYIADINVSYGAVAGSFRGFGVVGFSVKSLDFGDIPLTTEDDPEGRLGRVFSPTFLTLGFSYARALTDAISAGATVKLISERIERVSSSGVAFDLGVQYKGLVGISGLHLGVAIKNIGPQMKYDGPGLLRTAITTEGRRPDQRYKVDAAGFELPSLVEIGLGYDQKLGNNMMARVSTSFTNNNLYLDEYRVGGELEYGMESLRLFGRGGIGLIPDAGEREDIFGATLGGGFRYIAAGVDLTIEYAYRQAEFFKGNQVFSVKLAF